MNRTRNEITAASIIPVGILNSEITLPNTSTKELIITACPLQKDIFQSTISFKISPNLLQTNIKNPIDSVAISYNEGLNWEYYDFSEQSIEHSFERLGIHKIGIKLITSKGDYITYSELNVKQLIRPVEFVTNRVTANSIMQNANAKITENVNGGEYRILLGCDGLFDKPIIIAEGFDINQDVNLDSLRITGGFPL